MFLSGVSVLVVAQSSSEFPEVLMNNPVQPNLSYRINKIDDILIRWGEKILFRLFMGILLGIQPIVRLRIYENDIFTCTVLFETGCERNKTERRCASGVKSTSLSVRHTKIL